MKVNLIHDTNESERDSRNKWESEQDSRAQSEQMERNSNSVLPKKEKQY